jgi:hypothetical protein
VDCEPKRLTAADQTAGHRLTANEQKRTGRWKLSAWKAEGLDPVMETKHGRRQIQATRRNSHVEASSDFVAMRSLMSTNIPSDFAVGHEQESDDQLLCKAKSGNQHAFAELCLRYRGMDKASRARLIRLLSSSQPF